jgi:hypothetical protein
MYSLNLFFYHPHERYLQSKGSEVDCGVARLSPEVYLFGLSGYSHPSKEEATVPRFREL